MVMNKQHQHVAGRGAGAGHGAGHGADYGAGHGAGARVGPRCAATEHSRHDTGWLLHCSSCANRCAEHKYDTKC